MNWLIMGLKALARLPLEKVLVKRPDPVGSINRLEQMLKEANPQPSSAGAGSRGGLGSAAVMANKQPKVTTEETIAYQKREIGKELLLLEKHLQQRCKIAGKACDCCLPPGTAIYTNPATQAIEEVGGPVLTHRGKWAPIMQKFERNYNGELREIMTTYTNFPLILTPEHPILIARDVRKKQRDLWRQKGIDEETLAWLPASMVTERDFMAFPRLKLVRDRKQIGEELAELIGWFVAEGSKYHNRITFSLGKGEEENIHRVQYLIETCLGSAPKLYDKPTEINICFTNVDKVGIFDQFGSGARKKRLPHWFLLLPEAKLRSFLKGLICGDGHISSVSVVITTTSAILAFQLRLLLFKIGILHSLQRRPITDSIIMGRTIHPNGPRYDILIAGDAARSLPVHFDGGQRTVGNHGFMGKKYAFLPVKSNLPIKYVGRVYNIAVEGDESYVTPHGAVHNCEKHPLAIEALAQETLGITGDGLYHEIATWARNVMPITTEAASRSGRYDEEYPPLAVTARNLRKRIMGTEDIKALLSPELDEKVYADVQDILDKAFKKEGGNDGATEETV